MFHVRSMRRRGRSRVGAQPRRYNQFGRRSRRICHPLRCSDVRKRSVSFGRGAQHWCPRVAAVTVIRRRRSRDRQTRTPTYFVGGQRGYKRFTVNRKVYQWRRNFLFFSFEGEVYLSTSMLQYVFESWFGKSYWAICDSPRLFENKFVLIQLTIYNRLYTIILCRLLGIIECFSLLYL